jgi:hypothetical protein
LGLATAAAGLKVIGGGGSGRAWGRRRQRLGGWRQSRPWLGGRRRKIGFTSCVGMRLQS